MVLIQKKNNSIAHALGCARIDATHRLQRFKTRQSEKPLNFLSKYTSMRKTVNQKGMSFFSLFI